MAIGAVFAETSLVIDTDILTDWRYHKQYVRQAITEYISRVKKAPALTSLNVFEVIYGFENKAVKSNGLDERTTQDRLVTEQLIRDWTVLPFDETAAMIAAYIYPRLSQSERNKHWQDLFIAATALSHGYGVATRNKTDFELIANHLPPSHTLLPLVIWKP
jgi:predicted nucleic acid-binding protein